MNPAASPISCGAACRLWLKDGLDGIRTLSMAGKNFLREQSVNEDDLVACELVLVEACNNAVLYTRPTRDVTTQLKRGSFVNQT